MVRTVTACALAALAVVAALVVSGSTADTDPAEVTHRPLLIHYEQSFPTTEEIAAHPNWYRSLPFDGFVVGGREVDDVSFIDQRTSYSEKAILREVRKLPADMGTARHNFFGLRLIAPLDWSDDAQWRRIESNLRNLAHALRVSGKPWDGVFLDNEWYGDGTSPWDYGAGGDPWNYSDTEGATPGLGPVEAMSLVRARGRQVMEAMVEEWPGIVVFNSQGPWISQPATTGMLEANGVDDNDVSFANELSGSFTIGMMEATWGTSATLVDGGRFYGLRTPAQFRAARAWMRQSFPDLDTLDLDAQEIARYKANISASFGIYDRDKNKKGWPRVPPHQLALLTSLALQQCDEYVWLYTETYDWGRGASWKNPVPRDYIVAMAAARAAAMLTRPWTAPPERP